MFHWFTSIAFCVSVNGRNVPPTGVVFRTGFQFILIEEDGAFKPFYSCQYPVASCQYAVDLAVSTVHSSICRQSAVRMDGSHKACFCNVRLTADYGLPTGVWISGTITIRIHEGYKAL